MTGGLQRQANLRALHDRTRQYEATTLRGLFRFLRFIDRMRESGGDLGTARALGEQEDVVRIMSIHKSKGLEFPVVFAAGLGKSFNRRDLHSPFLMHKQLGFGPRFVDTELRVAYPTLPYLAIRQRLGMESLAEEMRILYVALTRPKEKMFLVGTVGDAAKQLQRWQSALDAHGRLPDFRIAGAGRFLDWLVRSRWARGFPSPSKARLKRSLRRSKTRRQRASCRRRRRGEEWRTPSGMPPSRMSNMATALRIPGDPMTP